MSEHLESAVSRLKYLNQILTGLLNDKDGEGMATWFIAVGSVVEQMNEVVGGAKR